MNGGGVHPLSILLTVTESELGFLIEVFGDDENCCKVLSSWRRISWYRVEAVESNVSDVFRASDKNFLTSLTPASARIVREKISSENIAGWWPDIPRELVSRAVKMEKRLLGRAFHGAELRITYTIHWYGSFHT